MKKNIFNIITIISLLVTFIIFIAQAFNIISIFIALSIASTVGLLAIFIYSLLDIFKKNNKALNMILLIRLTMVGGIALTFILAFLMSIFSDYITHIYYILDLSKVLKSFYDMYNYLSLTSFGVITILILGLGVFKIKKNYLLLNSISIILIVIRLLLNILYYLRSVFLFEMPCYVLGFEFGYAVHLPLFYLLSNIFLTIGLISFSLVIYNNTKSQIK